MLPWSELDRPAVLALLLRFGVEVVLAVRPDEVERFATLASRWRGEGIRVSAWPMLADGDGRWASAHNAPRWIVFARRVLDAAPTVTGLVVDLEPPITEVRALLAGPRRALHAVRAARARDMEPARAAFAAFLRELAAREVETTATILPHLLLEAPGRERWQRLTATPALGLPWSRVNVMLYTSMLEGWSRGLLDRRRARALLGAGCRRARRRFGPTAGVSLGAVGPGALGDEPTYRSPAELRDDVATARASGIEDLALFDLAGVIRPGPAEEWLEAFAAEEADALRCPGR